MKQSLITKLTLGQIQGQMEQAVEHINDEDYSLAKVAFQECVELTGTLEADQEISAAPEPEQPKQTTFEIPHE